VAQVLARACGHIGSGAEYLFKTVQSLEKLGIRDPYLWRVQKLVAAEVLKYNLVHE
jgi:cation transport protein ChaC